MNQPDKCPKCGAAFNTFDTHHSTARWWGCGSHIVQTGPMAGQIQVSKNCLGRQLSAMTVRLAAATRLVDEAEDIIGAFVPGETEWLREAEVFLRGKETKSDGRANDQ